jgi:hypothetical protein
VQEPTNTHGAGDIQQDKDGNAVAMTNEIMAKIFEHNLSRRVIAAFAKQ